MTAIVCTRRPGSLWSKCPCPDCRARHRRLDKRLRVYGTSCGITWEAAWDAFRVLADREWSARAIADAHQLCDRNITDALTRYRTTGQPTRFAHATRIALLAPGRRPTIGWLGATGARRRLQALAHAGHTTTDIANRTRIPISVISVVQTGKQPTLSAINHFRIVDLYDQLAAEPGPSQRAAQRARKHDWQPATAWDGTDIDNPTSKPHCITWDVEEAARLRGEGWAWDDLSRLYGYSRTTIRERINRHHETQEAAA